MWRALLVLIAPLASAAPLPEFTINLDLPPKERQRDVALHFKDTYPGFMRAWEGFLSRKVSPEERAAWMENHHASQELSDEIQGFVDALGNEEVTFERLMLFNLMYELNFPVFCSGIVAVDGQGRVLHGRNLDMVMTYRSGTNAMDVGSMFVNLTYVRNGTRVFNSHGIAGSVGANTAMKVDQRPWSIQQNSHFDNNRRKNLQALQEGAVPFSFVVRGLLQIEQIGFKEAVFLLSNTSFAAPSFFLMAGGGPWEGANLETKRSSPDPVQNRVQVLAPQVGRWFLVQTNDRIWDEPQDDRRNAAMQLVQSVGTPFQMNEDALMRIMRTAPLFNDYTAMSVVSVPSTGRVKSLSKDEYSPSVQLFAANRHFKVLLRR